MEEAKMVRSQTAWRWAWGVWAGASLSSFAVLESVALRRHSHPTLSTTLRRTMGIYPRHRGRSFALGALTAFWVWLTVHLAYVPEDVACGESPPPGTWVQVAPSIWYRIPRRKTLI